MKGIDKRWAESYAKQALSDLRARECLIKANAEKCHRLHFLQMAAEKACKAHLVTMNGYASVRKSHAYVASVLPMIARQFYVATSNNPIPLWEISEIRRLAQEIEILSPALDGGALRQDNSEYPWTDGTGNIFVPCEYNFPHIDDGSRSIVRLIRLIRAACESYTR